MLRLDVTDILKKQQQLYASGYFDKFDGKDYIPYPKSNTDMFPRYIDMSMSPHDVLGSLQKQHLKSLATSKHPMTIEATDAMMHQNRIVLLLSLMMGKDATHTFLMRKCSQHSIHNMRAPLDAMLRDREVAMLLKQYAMFNSDITIPPCDYPPLAIEKQELIHRFLLERKIAQQIQANIKSRAMAPRVYITHLPSDHTNNQNIAVVREVSPNDGISEERAKRKRRSDKLKKHAIQQIVDAVIPLNKFPFKSHAECTSKERKAPFYISKEQLANLIDSDPDLKKYFKNLKSSSKMQVCDQIFGKVIKN
jgi:hypothetical protein